jgi:hypothetical protein
LNFRSRELWPLSWLGNGRFASFGSLLAIAAVAMPASSFAAAWTLTAGDGQAITTISASRATLAFDSGRSLGKTTRYQKLDAQTLIEYGATDRLTAVLSSSFKEVEIGTSSDARTGDPDYVGLGARYRLAQRAGWVFSAQATIEFSARSGKGNAQPVDDTGTEIDVRGLIGHSFSLTRHPAFIDLQLAQRFRSGAEPSEVHVEATLGLRPNRRLLLLVQSFNVISEGAGAGGLASYEYYKFQPGAVYRITGRRSIEAAAFATVSGRNSIQENGATLGVWYDF